MTFTHKPEPNPLYERLKGFPIEDLAPVFSNGVRGRTLSARNSCWLLPQIKKCGVKVIIDLRTADHTDRYEQKVLAAGLEYRHIAIDSKNTDVREIIDLLPSFFDWLDAGDFYLACAMGLHRTDIALAIYYVFHPDVPLENAPELKGHKKDGKLRCDDIARRLNSIMKSLTEDDCKRMGLSADYEKTFIHRKKYLLATNS